MAWLLNDRVHRHFARNPLSTVVTQLRFHPILKVEANVAGFQEQVRATFPTYEMIVGREVSFDPSVQGIEVRDTKSFQFSTPDQDMTVSLGIGFLSLETKAYTDHGTFLQHARVALDALHRVYGPVAPTRLGLRYVNLIRKSVVEEGLGRATAWSDLVMPEFLSLPAGRVDLKNTLFASEVTSSMPIGALTLRYGLLRTPALGEHFRFDMDRYVEAAVDLPTVAATLEGFSGDLYSLFEGMAGPALLQWMEAVDAT
jgi:uncharacterized protein (TIGR04255 family)